MKTSVIERHPHPKYPRLRIELRTDSKFYQAVTRLDNKLRQKSMAVSHLPTALKLAEDWYKREVRASASFGMQHPIQQLTHDPTMAELFASYRGTLNPKKETEAKNRWSPIAEFWRALTLANVNTKAFTDFYKWRQKSSDRVEVVKNHTLHKDVVLIRQVLKHAIVEGLLDRLPVIPPIGKIEANSRPWLTEQEWRHLWSVSKKRIEEAKDNPRVQKQRQDLHDLIVFLYHAMCRVDEIVKSLRFRDCHIEKNEDGQKMLICEVSGKTGTRDAVMTFGAASVYERRLAAMKDKNGYIFPNRSREAFKALLYAAGLRKNRDGFTRNLKSLRSTSISQRILNQPELNLTAISRSSGVSVDVIDKYYAKRLTAKMQKHELSRVATKKAQKDRADDYV